MPTILLCLKEIYLHPIYMNDHTSDYAASSTVMLGRRRAGCSEYDDADDHGLQEVVGGVDEEDDVDTGVAGEGSRYTARSGDDLW